MNTDGLKITGVVKGSVADELGIKGGRLTAFDGYPAEDFLDYVFYNGGEKFVMNVEENAAATEYDIEKDADEDLGLILDENLDTLTCRNDCIFCFVDQLPADARASLKVKDDDYRQSFVYGNYVTLTNVGEREMSRIKRLKLSPLYVSVHSTEQGTRLKLLGVKRAPDILTQLKELNAAGITVHAQVVLCEGINDGYDLYKTAYGLQPLCKSLSVVPVGLTKYKNKALKPVSKECAAETLKTVHACQKEFLKRYGSRFVFAADELYLKAGAPMPEFGEYEDFYQLENGVGMWAKFKNEFYGALKELENAPPATLDRGGITVATGTSAYGLIKELCGAAQSKFGVKADVYAVENKFFGPSVTVSGLICGRDLTDDLKRKAVNKESRVLISKSMLRGDGVFLDGLTLSDAQKESGLKITPVENDGEAFARALILQ